MTDSGGKPTFVRLVVTLEHEDSRQQMGVVQAAYHLIRSKRVSAEEKESLRGVTRWMDKNVEAPDDPDPRAIFWFKPSAGEATQMLWGLAQLLRLHGFLVEMLKTDRPGYVVYEDDLQVAAIPFRDTF